jgi:beta-glucosidase-like glycosyl hydrolase
LCTALRSEIDLSRAVSKSLLAQLISAIKSTNANVRDASQRATLDLIKRCSEIEALTAIAEILTKAIKDGISGICNSSHVERSVDIRLTFARIIERFPQTSVSLSLSIVKSLIPLFSKETNEAAISALTQALATHQRVLLQNDVAIDDTTQKLVISGLTDKRSKIKAGWAVAMSEIIWECDITVVNPSSITFSKAIAKHLLNTFSEVTSNTIQSSQSGTITAAYAISAAALGRWLKWQDDQLGSSIR